jgi:serine/threonine-protein phosphatase 5
LTKADLINYKTLFSKYSAGGAVLAKNAPALFAPFGLDQNTLREIWVMADVGRKGNLTSFEFIVAMHLVTCISQRGAKMPESPPFELTKECILAVVNGKPLPSPGMNIFRRLCKFKMLRKQAKHSLLTRALRDLENAEVQDLALYHSQLREKYMQSLKDSPFNQAANIQSRLQARIATIGASLAERPWRPVSIPFLKDEDPITLAFVQSMLTAFRRGEFLSYENAWQILKRISAVLAQERTVQYASIVPGCRMVVVGDLHGQLDDFMYVLHNSGLPSATNHILFNGDFVDRGNNSCEVVFSIFALKLACPGWVFLNRGNHEAAEINEANGFTVECSKKYDRDLFSLFSDTFACLPLAHVINNKIFVVHGGLSWQDFKVVDLDKVNRFIVDPVYGTLMSDLLWSDPDLNPGRAESRRGTGCHFGPDVVKAFLSANNLDIIIRSHEVCDGVEYWFDGNLITVFSASNYCGDTGNIGGFLVVDSDLKVATTTYQEDQLLTAEQKANKSKHTSIDLPKCLAAKLRQIVLEKRPQLEAELAKLNEEGMVSTVQWSTVLQKVLAVRTPFVLLASNWGFAKDQVVHYSALLDKLTEI